MKYLYGLLITNNDRLHAFQRVLNGSPYPLLELCAVFPVLLLWVRDGA